MEFKSLEVISNGHRRSQMLEIITRIDVFSIISLLIRKWVMKAIKLKRISNKTGQTMYEYDSNYMRTWVHKHIHVWFIPYEKWSSGSFWIENVMCALAQKQLHSKFSNR